MCGISGVVGRQVGLEVIQRTLDVQTHRGPDDRGYFLHPSLPVALCHNRLAILDRSPAGHQPMASPDGAVHMVFNGEVYNYRELRARLADYPYNGTSDSEVVLAAYLAWGEACVESFIGMFSFAIWDGSQGKLFCARDRLGIKPFHYSTVDGAFTFASEVKGLEASGISLSPDRLAWAQYLVHGYTDHSERTFFDGVSVLPAGCSLTVTVDHPADVRIRRYWDLPALTRSTIDISDAEACETFLDLLDDAVSLRLRSDVPLGVNLSGGLDSASLMTSVDRLAAGLEEVQTFTASFADPTYDEADWADLVPRVHPWKRFRRRLDPSDVVALAGHAVEHQEAPFGGIATLGYHHLHGLAKEQNVTVLLEGQGVDELLGGYRYFLPHHLLDLREAGQSDALERELSAQGDAAPALVAEMERITAGTDRVVYQDGTSHLRPTCVRPEVLDLAGPKPSFPRPYPDRLRNVLLRDLLHTKLPRVLRMNDRLSMAFSRELREPYLDHRIVEFVFSLPGRFKIRGGQSKALLRMAMADRLPESVRGTPKRAVVTPQREWLQGVLAPWVTELLTSASFRERNLFLTEEVAREFGGFKTAGGENAFFVWQWVNTELWFRRFGG